jgi:hypothetical protein
LQPSKPENGSAAVDFILTAIPLTLVFVSVISICASSYVLGLIRDTAVEGARFAALADQSSATGCQKARSLLSQVLANSLNHQISCSLVQINSKNFEAVRIEVPLPLAGTLIKTNVLEAEGWAPREEQ